ncbi:hypothetical protein KM043_007025 [Ampulex compressa]|nr:hypothetical protein KM043_007025 [Ampulex compressa]
MHTATNLDEPFASHPSSNPIKSFTYDTRDDNKMKGNDTSHRRKEKFKYHEQIRPQENNVSISRPESSGTEKHRKRRFAWCVACCVKKIPEEPNASKPSVSVLGRWKKRSKACTEEKAVPSGQSSGTSAASHREESLEDLPRSKSKKERKKRKKSKESRTGKAPESGTKRSKEKEKKDQEKVIDYMDVQRASVDPKLLDYGVFQRVPPDFTKSCCYLCAQNTAAIAAAIAGKSRKLDQCVQASIRHRSKETTFDKSCSAMQVKTVQSSIKVKTREVSVLCPGSTQHKGTQSKSKPKKFNIFPKLKATKCPAMRTIGCEAAKLTRCNSKIKCGPRHEQCCKEKNT